MTRSGYADVNGLHLYHEVSGEGSPLVLLPAGMMTTDLSFAALIPELATRHTVIAVEPQGHGRTADIDRDISFGAWASDVVALLDHLGIDRAHVLGHSMGAGVALELAISHPDRVRSIVPISGSLDNDGQHPDLKDPSTYATSELMPTPEDFAAMQEAYVRLSPHPERFQDLMARMSVSIEAWKGWTGQQTAAITAPALIVVGDRDFTTVEHAAEMLRRIRGSQLAVLPGTTHMQATRRADLLLPMLATFLD